MQQLGAGTGRARSTYTGRSAALPRKSAVPRATPSDDPPPQPPVRPALDDCCHSGCTQCVFDLYDEALERYEVALSAWRARQARPPQKQGAKLKPQADPPRSAPSRAKPRPRR
ncbi:oxidoreductase-like domain-containing protein [Paraburkholderia sp. MMS20-SJTN17]|uniref:Oxidoreductase-like domain-containing protein n=1 Tax=Paraburkholderia translucens TaxID=2886945 RepID=A0ABS8KHR3_9BURK|nr:oxidoreductase-like domain-containing protein [Paraburkholderia sp. MMS20-SJTN17]MCC8403973.1 oxidoreductase-like domain-containing protein [Paraburkholderia sp. MMS20-SJTN17]